MTTANASKKQSTPLLPSRFAFGGGTKPISELMFNKYDVDKNGYFHLFQTDIYTILF
jgi:hypothetical protein